MPIKKTKNTKNAKKSQSRTDDDKNYDEWKSKLKLIKEWDKEKIFYIPVRESIENKQFTAPTPAKSSEGLTKKEMTT